MWLSYSVSATWFQRRAGPLNAFLLGESEARHLGVPVERMKLELIVLAALGVGIAVACSGIIGFVGLVVPHLVRLSCGPDHRRLLPLSAHWRADGHRQPWATVPRSPAHLPPPARPATIRRIG